MTIRNAERGISQTAEGMRATTFNPSTTLQQAGSLSRHLDLDLVDAGQGSVEEWGSRLAV